jgi:hypothetical protein
MLDSHLELAIPPETGFLNLGPKLKGSGDKLWEQFFRALINYPKPTPCWPDFEIAEDPFWAALTQIIPFTIAEGTGHSIGCTLHASGSCAGVTRRRFIA